MDIVIEEVTSASRRMTFVLPSAAVGDEMNQITREMAKTVSLPGFRKGKVPPDVVKRKFGDQIQNDAIVSLVSNQVKDTMIERDIQPIRQPSIDKFKKDEHTDDYEITVSYEVVPEFDNPTLQGEQLINPILEFSNADVNTIVERWQVAQQAYESVEGPVENGDQVHVNVELFADGESKWGAAERIVVEPDKTEVEQLKEVYNACIGKTVGEEFKVKDLDEKAWAGSDGDDEAASGHNDEVDAEATEAADTEMYLEAEVVDVLRPVPGELSENILKQLGAGSRSDDDFLQKARAEIERQSKAERLRLLREHAVTLLLTRTDFMPPESLISERLIQQLQSAGLNSQQIQEEMMQGFESELIKGTSTRVMVELKISMILDRIQTDRSVQIDEQEMEAYVQEKLNQTGLTELEPSEQLDQAIANLKQNSVMEFMQHKILDLVLQDADLQDQKMGLDEFETWAKNLMNPDSEDQNAQLAGAESVEPETELAQPTADDGGSVILDAAGNPIDKSKLK